VVVPADNSSKSIHISADKAVKAELRRVDGRDTLMRIYGRVILSSPRSKLLLKVRVCRPSGGTV